MAGWAPWANHNWGLGMVLNPDENHALLDTLGLWSALGMGGAAAALCAIFGRDVF